MQIEVHRERLANRITLITVPAAGTEAVTAMALMGVGSRYESPERFGLAHFTEHMVFKGGGRYPNAAAVAQALDAVGGEFNAFTSQEFTGFYARTAARHLPTGLGVLSDMLLRGGFAEEEIEKEKGVIVEEINMYADMPQAQVDHLLMENLYAGTALAHPILGTKETVRSFTRQHFLEYRDEFYGGERCVVVLAGNIKPEEARRLVEAEFADLPAGRPYSPAPAAVAPATGDRRVFLRTTQAEQSHLILTAGGVTKHDPRRYAQRLLTVVLGGNMSSRLFTEVREKRGLCYYVRAQGETFSDTATLQCSAGVDNERIPLAVEAIANELRRMAAEPVPAAELERAKGYVAGRNALALEDSEHLAEYFGLQALLDEGHETPQERLERLQVVTAGEIRDLAADLFRPENYRLAAVGPYSDAPALSALLT